MRLLNSILKEDFLQSFQDMYSRSQRCIVMGGDFRRTVRFKGFPQNYISSALKPTSGSIHLFLHATDFTGPMDPKPSAVIFKKRLPVHGLRRA
ncbi:hypothetical protein TNCV_4252511 [Trichonephila clavipes]|nr:hypothetical protein TNCV_4252511 [Trichonephila clavipes]